MTITRHSPYVIVGAGIHGLSTASHLALRLKASGKGVHRPLSTADCLRHLWTCLRTTFISGLSHGVRKVPPGLS